MVTRRKKTTKRTTTKRKVASKKVDPSLTTTPWELVEQAGLQEPVYLDLEWGTRLPGTTYVKGVGTFIEKSKMTPIHSLYAAKPYSWMDYVSKRAQKKPMSKGTPTSDTGSFTLRDDQIEDKNTIVSLLSRKNRSEFLLASGTGVGKTVTSVAAVNELPGNTVLVVCPKSVIPAWRLTLENMGDGDKTWIIINYESTKKLLQHTAKSASGQKSTTRNKNLALYGKPLFKADIVITDESHKVKNATSQQTKVVEKFLEEGAKSLRLSATPGENPAQIYYLRRGLTEATGDSLFTVSDDDYSEFVKWATNNKIQGLTKARFGNGIEFNGTEDDVTKMKEIIFDSKPQWALRRIPESWPEQDRVGVPIEFTPEEMAAYNTAWEEFSSAMKKLDKQLLTAKTKKVQSAIKMKGLAEQTRYRQKVGQLKIPAAIEHIKEILDNKHQVIVNLVYKDTASLLAEKLAENKIESVSITGSNVTNRETDRVRFQQGEVKVLINSISEGVSYHQGDKLVNGNDVPRETLVLETNWSAIKELQSLGRGHRDGRDSPAKILMATNTVDVKVVTTLLKKMNNLNNLIGSDDETIKSLADDFGFTIF